MTTIVCNMEEMAVDSLCTDSATKCSVTKMFRVGETLVGVAGVYADCKHFINWLTEGGDPDETPDMEGVAALVLTKKGIYLYDSHPTPFKVDGKFAAIGSGSQAALAAMYYGASPRDAVKMAAKVDPHTGGRINVKPLDPKAPAPKKRKACLQTIV